MVLGVLQGPFWRFIAVAISGVIRRETRLTAHIRGLITPLLPTP